MHKNLFEYSAANRLVVALIKAVKSNIFSLKNLPNPAGFFDEAEKIIQYSPMFYNPYTEKIGEYPNILNDDSVICGHKGKWKTFFQKEKLMLEIGTGMGNFFANYAENNPAVGCIGIELKFKRLYRTYEKCVEKGRRDIILLRIMGQRIIEIFETEEVDEVYLLFSDPWPKKAHHKHRIIQPEFLKNISKILAPNGIFFIKTDDDAYATWISEHLDQSGIFEYQMTVDEDPEKRANPKNSTEFETIWRSQGKKITAFICKKK
ncbi:MAG: tRNA (guanosine(46)-N7)-methyltransferase TrmB [Candidatus Gracilibacteria bacterium]